MCARADNVVAINHQGFEEDVAMCESIPELDLVIGGHSHVSIISSCFIDKEKFKSTDFHEDKS